MNLNSRNTFIYEMNLINKFYTFLNKIINSDKSLLIPNNYLLRYYLQLYNNIISDNFNILKH